MQSLKQNKTLVTIFLISLVAFLFYQFKGKDTVVIDPALVGNEVVSDQTTADILLLLNKMQQASIDGDFFTSTAWTNLVDQSTPLPTDAPGRSNLFEGTLQGQSISPVASTSRP